MAKRKAKPQTASNPSFRGFLNINLTDEDRSIVKATSYTAEQFVSDLDRYGDSGYKFSFSYDDYSHCYQCIGTVSDKEHEDYGILLTGRGSTQMKAFKQWVYIETRIIGESSWSDMLKPDNRYQIDD